MSSTTMNPPQTKFLNDVISHEMKIFADNDVNRTLRFSQPARGNQYFYITTWPGHLCISGDMGTFVFSRLPDMFEFFRGDKEPNLGYWSEKLEAGNAKKYSEKEAEAAILNQLEYEDLNTEEIKTAKRYIKQLDLGSEHSFFQELMSWDDDEAGFQLDASELGDCKEYTYHFTWCCHAIIWAIQQYDLAKAEPEAA